MLSARQLPFLAGAGLLLAALACLAMLSGHNDELLEVQRAAPPRMSSLMWIAAPNTNTPNDFMEFRNNCLAACSAAQLDQSKCYTQITADQFVMYQNGCEGADKCKCQMKTMSCGGYYGTKMHPSWGAPGYCA